MAPQSTAPAQWRHDPLSAHLRPADDEPAERLASWLMIYLTALLSSVALVGSAWVLVVVR